MESVTRPRATAVPLAAAPALLCAVHCVAAPLLVAFSPALAENGMLEWGLLALAAALASPALARVVRTRTASLLLLPLGGGLGLWSASLAGLLAPLPEQITTVMGSLAVAWGMYWHVRMRHATKRERCACGACPPEQQFPEPE